MIALAESLADLREAMNHTCSLVESQIRDVRLEYERKIDDLTAEFKQSLATATSHLRGERDEARRHVDTLTGELRALRAQLALPAPRPVYGLWDCRQCAKPFERQTKGQKTCGPCKQAQSRRNAEYLKQRGGLPA